MSARGSIVNIIDGPGVDRVINSLLYAYDKTLDVSSVFRIEDVEGSGTYRFAECKIIGVEYESDLPGRFILTMIFNGGRHRAHYDANNRKGYIHLGE